jgi:hypothetical protein
MKHLRRFNEKLSPGFYNRAAQGKEKIHGDVDAAKALRDWAKTSESGGKGYDIVYSCINPDKSQVIYNGIDYTAQMVKPTVRCVFFGSALSRNKSYDTLVSNTMESVIEDWMVGNGPLSVSMVVDFETTETVDKTWTYEITISGRKIGESEDQFQTVTVDALNENEALKKLVNMIKSSYPKIIGNPLESDVVKYKLVKGPSLGVDPKTSELMNKVNGVGWGSNKFGRWNKNLSTFVIEVRLSDSTYGLGGKYHCHACGGAVTMDCYDCDGEGSVWSDEADDNVTCTTCNGTGTITCGECNGEDMTKGITKSKFLVDTFRPEVTMRPIPGKAPGNQSEVYSKYPWIGMFRTRDDARRFLSNEWQRLINEDPRTRWNKYGGVGGSFYEAVTDLVKEVMDVNDTKTMDYMEDVVSAIENISVGAMVDNGGTLAVASLASNPRNISTFRPKK